jgi:hypothetical protein
MATGSVICEKCNKVGGYRGNCPNDVMMSTGFTQSDEDYSKWYCPDCKPEVEVKDAEISFTVSGEGFNSVFGRLPESVEEFDDFVYFTRKAVESQLDWSIVYDCVKEEME